MAMSTGSIGSLVTDERSSRVGGEVISPTRKTSWSDFTADQFETAIARALHDKDLKAAVSLLRIMAVQYPARCEVLLNGVESVLDTLRQELEAK